MIEFVDQMKILGVIVNSKLSWDENTQVNVQKINQ